MENQEIIEVESIYDYIKDTFANIFISFSDVKFKDKNAPLISIPLLAIHSSGIYIFNDSDDDEQKLKRTANEIITYIKELIEINSSHIYYYALKEDIDADENSLGWFTKIYISSTKQTKEIKNLIEYLYEQIEFRNSILSEDLIQDIETEIKLNLNQTTPNIISKGGKRFILKRQNWYEVSEINENWFFHLTLFFGMFGFHKFSINQIFIGFMYLITLGFFGVGWFFDNLQIIFGHYRIKKRTKDRNTYYQYIAPMKDQVIKFLFLIGFSFIVFPLVKFYLNIVITIVSWIAIGKI